LPTKLKELDCYPTVIQGTVGYPDFARKSREIRVLVCRAEKTVFDDKRACHRAIGLAGPENQL
jgi:hypothetical protein